MKNNYEKKYNISYEVTHEDMHIYTCDEIGQLEDFIATQDFKEHVVDYKILRNSPGKRHVLYSATSLEAVVREIDRQEAYLLSFKGEVS